MHYTDLPVESNKINKLLIHEEIEESEIKYQYFGKNIHHVVYQETCPEVRTEPSKYHENRNVMWSRGPRWLRFIDIDAIMDKFPNINEIGFSSDLETYDDMYHCNFNMKDPKKYTNLKTISFDYVTIHIADFLKKIPSITTLKLKHFVGEIYHQENFYFDLIPKTDSDEAHYIATLDTIGERFILAPHIIHIVFNEPIDPWVTEDLADFLGPFTRTIKT